MTGLEIGIALGAILLLFRRAGIPFDMTDFKSIAFPGNPQASIAEYKASLYAMVHSPQVVTIYEKWPKEQIIKATAGVFGLNWKIACALITNESGFQPGAIAGYKGPGHPDAFPNSTAFGLCQQTRKWMPDGIVLPHWQLWYPPLALTTAKIHLDGAGFQVDPAAALAAYSYGKGTAKGVKYANKILAKAADPSFLGQKALTA